MQIDDFFDQMKAALEADDLEKLENLKDHFTDHGNPPLPFVPSVGLRSIEGDEALEADVAIAAANGLSRAIRKLKYRRKRFFGYSGPIVVSEGDSWFQFPIILDDVIDNLMDSYAVFSLGAAGDTLSNMLAEREYREAIEEEGADFFLFSAAGNDVLGGGRLADLLNTYEPGMEIGDMVRADVFAAKLAKIDSAYDAIIRDALSVNPRLGIMIHGYDRPVPRRDGKWLGRPMAERQIPEFLRGDVTAFLIDRFNERLATLETRFPRNVRHVDCRGFVGGSVQSWYDELHPRNAGFGRVADHFQAQIENLRANLPSAPVGVISAPISSDETWTPVDEGLAAVEEEAIIDMADLVSFPDDSGAPAHLSALDKEILEEFNALKREENAPDHAKRIRARRHMVPVDDDKAFERILGKSNLFPIN